MNVKVKAAVETAKTVILLTIAALTVPALLILASPGAIAFFLLVVCIVYGIKMIYDIKLSEAERESIVNIDKE